jgi:predicted amidohydrolase YtcJ
MGIWDDNKETISLETRIQALQFAINKMVSCGITAFQDAIVRMGNLEAYEILARNGKLPIKARFVFFLFSFFFSLFLV